MTRGMAMGSIAGRRSADIKIVAVSLNMPVLPPLGLGLTDPETNLIVSETKWLFKEIGCADQVIRPFINRVIHFAIPGSGKSRRLTLGESSCTL
jgi:hypothetical protein